MPLPKFKYNLQHRFSFYPNITWKMLELHAEQYGITARTFQRDRSILPDEAEDIPTERLVVYAKIFNCELEELINYKTKVKPFKP
jgi:hypothetical protein